MGSRFTTPPPKPNVNQEAALPMQVRSKLAKQQSHNDHGLWKSFQRFLGASKQINVLPAVANESEPTQETPDTYQILVKAEAHRYCNRFLEAQVLYEEVLRMEPANAQAWLGSIACWEAFAGLLATEPVLKEALQQCPLEKKLLWKAVAVAELTGQIEWSMRCLKRLQKLEPDNLEVLFQLALQYENSKDYSAAQQAYTQLLKREPNCLPAQHNMANIAMRLGQFREAESMFRALTLQAPAFAKGFLGLAISLEQLGQHYDACHYYQRFVELKPNGWQSGFARQRLLKLQNASKANKPLLPSRKSAAKKGKGLVSKSQRYRTASLALQRVK